MIVRGTFQLEMFRIAYDSIRAHKFRSMLTVLGIVIGVMTAITVASVLSGLRQDLINGVEDYGTNNLYIYHLSTSPGGNEHHVEERARKVLVPADAAAIRHLAPAVQDVALVAPSIGTSGEFENNIVHQGLNYRSAQTQGVTVNYARIANLALQEGRFLNELDDRDRRMVMVLGVKAAEALFPRGGPMVGTQVRMGGRLFEIIGVLEKRKGGFFGENAEDSAVYIPFRTARKIAPGSDGLILVVQAQVDHLDEALQQTEDVLRQRRRVALNQGNDFEIKSSDKIIEEFDSIITVAGLVAIAISSLSLVVGGIGIMNITFISVTERRQEIGIRRALGARRKDITRQFLYEATALTFCGGLLGIILALGMTHLIMLLMPSLPATIPVWAVISGIIVSIAIGIVFSVWPALRASRLDPVICLRYE